MKVKLGSLQEYGRPLQCTKFDPDQLRRGLVQGWGANLRAGGIEVIRESLHCVSSFQHLFCMHMQSINFISSFCIQT